MVLVDQIYLFAYTRVKLVQVHSAKHAAPMGLAHSDEDQDLRPCVGTSDAYWREDVLHKVHAEGYLGADQRPQ